jgi:hypothetical protein
VEAIARQRVQLLRATYDSNPNLAEITARLKILNSRLLAAAPRVTDVQVSLLEDAANRLQASRASLEERAQRLGISL